MKHCCCCISLRNGSIILGVLTLIMGLVYVGLFSYDLAERDSTFNVFTGTMLMIARTRPYLEHFLIAGIVISSVDVLRGG